jgi:hypothetical protein
MTRLCPSSIILTHSMTTSSATPTAAKPETRTWLGGGISVVLAIALAKLVLHIYFNNRYGYFRDEFDYLACASHLAWGYVDQPPLLPFLTRISRILLGDSLRAIRFLPALASSATVVLAAVLARRLGGRSFALLLAAVGVVVSPFYLSGGSLLTTNCLEPIFWMGCVYFVILAIQRNDPRYWLGFGLVAGLGMQEKYSIAVLGFAVVIGLLLTEQRRILISKWFWLAGFAAFLVFLPNLIWNIHYDWPFVQLMRNIKAESRDVVLSPFQYFAQQILLLHPFTAPVWITGVIAFFVARRFRPYRLLGWAYVVGLTVFIVLKGKNYYLMPIYPVFLAAGAVVIESGIERWRQGWLKPAIIVVLLAGGAVLAPLAMPILAVDSFIAYMDRLPIKVPRSEHSHAAAVLPQHYADQFGWQEIVAKTAEAWSRIPPDERHDCGIFAQDYGQAGAIDFFGPRYGLPPALSGHQTYFLWGPRGYSGNCLIVLDDTRQALERKFEQVEFVGTSADNPYALERQIPVFICRRPKFGTLPQVWSHLKKWR